MTQINNDIAGLRVERLQQFHDHRGTLMHILRNDAPWFEGFGEVYCSAVKGGAIKAWRRYENMIQNFAVPLGKIQLVAFDNRENSTTKGALFKKIVGTDDYYLVQIPAGVWYGFQGLASSESLVINCSTEVHDSHKIERLDPNDPSIPHTWKK